MPGKLKETKLKARGEVLHVRISYPLTVRKAVLNAAVGAASFLTFYDDLSKIRIMKGQTLETINNKFDEINKLFLDLGNKYLPELEVDNNIPSLSVETSKQEVNIKMEDSEIEKLKAELSEIEKKLKSL